MSFKAFCLLVFYCILLASARAQGVCSVFATPTDYEHFAGKRLAGINIERRSVETIYKSGGSDYQISAKNRFHKRFLKRGAFLVQSGESLYINCYLLDKGVWYAKAQRLDRQLLFLAPDFDSDRRGRRTVILPDGTKKRTHPLSRGVAALRRHYYTYDLDTDRFARLNKGSMLGVLQPYPALAERYRGEAKPEALRTFTLYIREYLSLREADSAPAARTANDVAGVMSAVKR